MADIFQDFVPEGEDAGALGGKGFQDFVPEREPELQELPTETVEKAPRKGKKAPKLSKEDLEDLGVKTEEVEELPTETVEKAPRKGKKAPKLSKEDLEDLGVKTEEVEEQPAEPVTSPEK